MNPNSYHRYRLHRQRDALIQARYNLISSTISASRVVMHLGSFRRPWVSIAGPNRQREKKELEMHLATGSWIEYKVERTLGKGPYYVRAATGVWDGTREQLDWILKRIFNVLKTSEAASAEASSTDPACSSYPEARPAGAEAEKIFNMLKISGSEEA